jgi:hypothetical protein
MMIYLVEDGDICGRRDNGHVVDHLITSALILNSTQRGSSGRPMGFDVPLALG